MKIDSSFIASKSSFFEIRFLIFVVVVHKDLKIRQMFDQANIGLEMKGAAIPSPQ